MSQISLLAEGGASVVFSHSRLPCCVLKVQKTEGDLTNVHHQQESLRNATFVTNNFRSWGKLNDCLVCSTEPHALNETEHQSLQAIWLAQQDIHRREENRNKRLSLVAAFEENISYCSVIHLSPDQPYRSLSLEIKVKGAFTSISPFICPSSSSAIKFTMSRYEIMQSYKQCKQSTEGADHVVPWGSFRARSSYRPQDLCCHQFDRMYEAVCHLFETPQNNLKVVVNGEHVYGWSKDDAEEFNARLRFLFSAQIDVTMMSKMTASALYERHHSVLAALLEIQVLDVLDSEGASFIYQHLVSSYYGGENARCLDDLTEYFLAPLDPVYHSFSAVVMKLRRDVSIDAQETLIFSEGIRQLLAILPMNAAPKRDVHERALALVQRLLTRADCLFLLKAWVLSTIACDASVVLRIAMDTAGDIISSEVTLIDCGLKSLTKLTTKAKKDAKICQTVVDWMHSSTSSIPC